MSSVVVITKDTKVITETRRAMELAGLNPIVTNNAFIAIEIMETNKTDLLICDQSIDNGKGISICLKIRESLGHKTPPILLLDEESDQAALTSAMCAGAQGVLSKIDSTEEIISRIKDYVKDPIDYSFSSSQNIFSKKSVRETDPVTGLTMRKYFERRLNAEWAYARYNGTPISLMMITPDKIMELKNDFGSEEVEKMLAKAAKVIEGTLSSRDCASRYDDDTFAVVLAETDDNAALKRASDISAILQSMPFGSVDNTMDATFSVSVTGIINVRSSSPRKIMAIGVKRVQSAMKAGGNQIISGEKKHVA
ncbi:MAG: diguanylate cyclase [Deltaproteobacteria bacterium]|nr:diguanylate cyclase [Deltaproteobacteria bacterium]